MIISWGDTMENEKENAIALKYSREYSVVQANELVRSKQDNLTLLEAKIVRLAISQVLENDTDFRTYSCNAQELAKFLGLDKDNVYHELRDISASLMKKSIYIKSKTSKRKDGKPNWKMFHWVDSIEYRDGIITFRLSESLKPYLLGLDELFTKYSYEALIKLPTTNSIRFYELMASWEMSVIRGAKKTNYTDIPIDDNEFIFTVDYLREYFNCVDKYPNTGDFIIRVIEKSIAAINKKTLMRVSYRKIKEGKSIKYLIFKLDDWGETPPEIEEKFARVRKILEELEQQRQDLDGLEYEYTL